MAVQIDRATYYNFDVTERLRQVVQQEGGRLYIQNGTDYNQLFGYDPAPGVGKQLTVLYRVGGSGEQQAVFNERQEINIQPQQQQVYQPQYGQVQPGGYAQQSYQQSGLIIDRAVYHNMDVTEHLRRLVQQEGGQRLYFPGGDYNAFFQRDPAPGVFKRLTIVYRSSFNEAPRESIFEEHQAFEIRASAVQQTVQYQQQSGLIVDRALYHDMDVTEHLRRLVAQEGGKRLYFAGGDYNGFFQRDPAPGVFKRLTIVYREGAGQPEKEAIFNEHDRFELFASASSSSSYSYSSSSSSSSFSTGGGFGGGGAIAAIENAIVREEIREGHHHHHHHHHHREW